MNNFTKILFVAFIISLCIHFMLFIAIEKTIQNENLNINTTNKKNTTKNNGLVKIKYVKLKPKQKKTESKNVNTTPKKTISKTLTKQSQSKKRVKLLSKNPKKKELSLIEIPKKEQQKLDLKQFFTIQEKEREKQEQKQLEKETEIANELQEIKKLPEVTQSYIKLYGEKYFEFSKEQRRYLKQNLNKIGEITQRYLTYPSISIRTKQQGVNVIEFFLHPNGDISDMKISDTSYYTALDKNTIETIKLAYQDYPKPREKVKIKIFVKYILY